MSISHVITLASSAAVLALLAGCSAPDAERTATAPSPQPTKTEGMNAEGVSAAPRIIGETERDAMLAALREDNPAVRKIWFAVNPGNAEIAALKDALEAIFKEAGWEAQTQTVTGMSLKPGLFMMAADEDPPPYVETAVKALEASGLPVKKGSGYRAYYEEKTRTEPKWAGIALAPDQDYVVVVGPNPPA